MSEIHAYFAAVEPAEEDHAGHIILRGKIDQNDIRLLKIDWYQRQQGFADKQIKELCEKLFNGKKLADIVVGMRGHRYDLRGNDAVLHDPLYVIDGVQRQYAAMVAMRTRPDLKISLGIKVYFDTNDDIENEMFCEMNSTQQRMAATVLVRDRYKVSSTINVLFGLNTNRDFALKDMVGWDQKNAQGQYLSGFGLCRVTGALFMHKGAKSGGKAYDLLAALDRACEKVSPDVLRDSVIRFFDVIDAAWRVRGAPKKPACLSLKFLVVLAQLFSRYDAFWDGDEFFMPAKYQKKLAKFDVAKIKSQVDYLVQKQEDAKDVVFEVLRKALTLDKINERKMPFEDDDGEEARA
jgi:hypothetical protein